MTEKKTEKKGRGVGGRITGGNGTGPYEGGQEEVEPDRGEDTASGGRVVLERSADEQTQGEEEVADGEVEHEAMDDLFATALVEGDEGDEDEEAASDRQATRNKGA